VLKPSSDWRPLLLGAPDCIALYPRRQFFLPASMIVNNERERMLKEAVVALFNVLYDNLPGGWGVTPWSETASDLDRPSDRRWSAK
jgi:hypothetical protein